MSKQTKVGACLIAAGLVTPGIAYFVMLSVMALIVVYNPGAPPSQGAILHGNFALLASVAVGIVFIGIGLEALVISFWKSRKNTPVPAQH